MRCRLHWSIIALCCTHRLLAQDVADVATPSAVIDQSLLERHANALAAFSQGGRETPSPALDRAAQYVASEFQQLGLRPIGRDNKTLIERYPIPGHLRLDPARSGLTFSLLDSASQQLQAQGNAGPATPKAIAQETLSFGRTVYLGGAMISPFALWIDGDSRGTLLVAGQQDSAKLSTLDLQAKIVVYVPPLGLPDSMRDGIINLLHAKSLGVVVFAETDSSAFLAARTEAERRPVRIVEPHLQYVLRPRGWVVYAWSGAVASLLTSVSVDVPRLRASDTSVITEIAPLHVQLTTRTLPLAPEIPTAPNVVGMLEGRDTAFAKDPILLLAHLDAAADSSQRMGAGNGADDNAAGVAALLAVAETFRRAEERPRRPVVFLATSGSRTHELWGSSFSNVRKLRLASVIGMELGGNVPGDSVWVAGLDEIDGVERIDWIAAGVPEVALTVVNDATAFAPRSDHFGLSPLGVPMLLFHAGRTHGEAVASTFSGHGDLQRATRIARLVYNVADRLANAPRRLQLTPTGRRNFLREVGQHE